MDNFHFGISKEKEIDLWTDSIVVFDSSALLNFYEYSKAPRKNIFDTTFRVLKDRLWIPHQVNYEFQKNRLKTLSSPISLYNELREQQLNKIQEQINQLRNRTKKHNKHPYLEQQFLNTFSESFDEFKKNINNEIDSRISEVSEMKASDDVLKGFKKYFKVGQEYNYSDLISIIKEGEFRYRNSIPPGYKDFDDKIGFQIYGDLILWKQIIDYAKIINKPIILVIDDVKEDWWHLNKRETERPREELLLEIKEFAKVDFWMYSSIKFLEKANEILNTKIKENSIMEVRNASIYHNAYLAERAFFKWAINEYSGQGEIIVPKSMVEGTDLILHKKDGSQIGFIVKFFSSGKHRFLNQRLRRTNEIINLKELRSKFDKIFIVLVTDDEDSSRSQLNEYDNQTQLSMFPPDEKTEVIFGYLQDEEFIKLN